MLKNFFYSIGDVLQENTRLPDQLKGLKNILTDVIFQNEFRLQCVDAVLAAIETLGANWCSPHLFYHEELKYSVGMAFWPAFYESKAIQDKSWRVIGILHNHLIVHTYRKDLELNKNILAKKGDVRYLFPGCIYSISNVAQELSCSIHIDSFENDLVFSSVLRDLNLTQGLVARALTVCIAMIAEIPEDKSLNLLLRIFDVAPLSLKMLAAQAMFLFNSDKAKEYFDVIEKLIKQ